MKLHAIGIDLGNTVFHLVGVNPHGELVVRKRFSRSQLLHFTVNLKVGVIGMEACGGAHFLGRALREQGHNVRLMPAQYVKPFVKTNKNDYIDAEAIAEAVVRPTMRFVPIKSDDQLDMQPRPGVDGVRRSSSLRLAGSEPLASYLTTSHGPNRSHGHLGAEARAPSGASHKRH